MNGEIEIQDHSSQLLANSILKDEAKIVLDACAGAGGKSLHIASKFPNSTVYSFDIHYKRLAQSFERIKRSRLKNIHIIKDLNDIDIKFDLILLDVPCSGSGTIRRSPELKYKVNNDSLNRIVQAQKDIILNYLKYLKPSGVLLYSTCSIFKEENEFISNWILEETKLKTLPLEPAFKQNKINIDTKSHQIQLKIGEHGGDGFYISKFILDK